MDINLKTKQISFTTSKPLHTFLPQLKQKLAEYSYSLTTTQSHDKVKLEMPLFISLVFVAMFLLLEKIGLSRFFNPASVTLPAVFTIGVLASLSSCMAVVGGLILSLTATKTNMLTFHLSRLAGFFILGGLIGFLGQNLAFTPTLQSIFSLIFIIAMLALGLSQLGLSDTIAMPDFLGKRLLSFKNSTHPLLPILLGTGTFILPCGFTQSMQLYSLTLKSPLQSALTMLVFALGTLPILASISLTSHKLKDSKHLEIFQKTTAFLIIFFALFQLYNLLI